MKFSKIEKGLKDNELINAWESVLKILTTPEGYVLKKANIQKQGSSLVCLFRCEKENGENDGLGGEHLSFVVNKENYTLMGMTWMDQRFSKGEQLPSEKRTEELAKSFLNWTQPGLFDRLENHWIRPHDEVITVNNEKITVTGMKYKCYLPDEDTWAWVIVGPDEKIMTFEQGIKWEGGRVTERWLHDEWLKNNE
jgi:hypothetical protein